MSDPTTPPDDPKSPDPLDDGRRGRDDGRGPDADRGPDDGDRRGSDDAPRFRRRRDDDDDDRPRRPRRRDDDDVADDERDDYDDGPRRRVKRSSEDGLGFIVPMNVSGWSLAACYLGLSGCVIIPFGPLALICGIIALRQARRRKKESSYGTVTSDIRAIIGVLTGFLSTLVCIVVLVVIILGK